MLSANQIVAFVGVTDADRARAFYRDTMGLKLVSEELPFALVFDANGVMLRVSMVGKTLTPAPYTVLGWQVPDIAAAARELTAAGVKMERFGDFMKQDELGIWDAPAPHRARVAWFKDPDGNILSISQHG